MKIILKMKIRHFVCLAILAVSSVSGLPVKEKPKEPEKTEDKPGEDSPTQNLEVSY